MVLLGITIAIFISPFLILSFFNYPGAEDYAEVVLAQEFGTFGYIKELYLTWDGRYFAAILFAFHPLVFNSFLLYKLVPIIFCLLLLLSIYMFLKETEVFKEHKSLLFTSSVVLFALCVYNIPSTVAIFYYYIMSAIYTPPIIGTLLLLSFIMRINKTSYSPKRLGLLFLSTILIYCIIGSLEIFIAIIPTLLITILLYQIILKRPGIKETIVLLITALSAGYINLSAPGIRLHFNQNPIEFSFEHLLSSLINCISVSNNAFQDFIYGNYLLFFASLFFILLFFQSSINIEFRKLKFIHVIGITLLIVLALHLLAFPFYWSIDQEAGMDYPKRLFSSIYIIFIFSWFLVLYFILSYFSQKTNWKFKSLNTSKLNLAFIICVIISTPFSRVWLTAVDDLYSGRAYNYHIEMQNRIEKFKTADSNTKVWIDTLKNKPLTIYSFVDLGPYRASNWNDSYEEYFDVKEIIVNNK